MKAPTIKDSRGNESTTLFMVIVAFLVLIGQVAAPYFLPSVDPVRVLDFAGAFGIVIAVWQGREYKQKDVERKRDVG